VKQSGVFVCAQADVIAITQIVKKVSIFFILDLICIKEENVLFRLQSYKKDCHFTPPVHFLCKKSKKKMKNG